jgi:hypothetical protein
MYVSARGIRLQDKTIATAWGTDQYPPKIQKMIGDLSADLRDHVGTTNEDSPSWTYPVVYARCRSGGRRNIKSGPTQIVDPSISIRLSTRTGIPYASKNASKIWWKRSCFDPELEDVEGLPLQPAGTIGPDEWLEDGNVFKYVEEPPDYETIIRSFAKEHWAVIKKAAWKVLQYEARLDEEARRVQGARDLLRREDTPLGRQAYERLCKERKVEELSDQEIIGKSYALRHGQFELPAYSSDYCEKMMLARERFKKMEKKAKPMRELHRKRAREQREKEKAGKPRCSYEGCSRPGTMMASLGRACPDHYDMLSGV